MRKIQAAVTDDDPDVQKSILKAYKDAGGDAGFSRWCKKHQTTLYDYYVKLMPQRVQSQVHITHVSDETARAKLYDQFIRIIDARQAGSEDPAVYVNGVRLTDDVPVTVDGVVVNDEPAVPRLASPDVVAAQPANPRPPADVAPPPAAAPPPLTPAQARERAMQPSYPPPVSNEPSTTAKYLEWASTRRDPWKNYG